MIKNFRTYDLAVQLYKLCEKLSAPDYLRNQLSRASSSVVLNLAEGTAKPSQKEKVRFYSIAFGSLRETQSILDLLDLGQEHEAVKQADHLGACLFKLVYQNPVTRPEPVKFPGNR